MKRSVWVCGCVGACLLGALGVLRAEEPGQAFRYDVSEFAATDPRQVRFRETARIPVDLESPAGLALDAAGRFWVVGSSDLLVLDPVGREVRRVPLGGEGRCVAVAPDGGVLVGLRHDIVRYDPDGNHGGTWAELGESATVTSIAATSNAVYVADAGNRMVWSFDAGGRLVRHIGRRDKGRGLAGFIVPSPLFDVAADASTLWAVNPGRQRIERYRPDGKLEDHWGEASMRIEGFCGCCNPSHIARMADGGFVTSEKGLARVKLYGKDGSFQGVVAGTEAFDEGTVGLDLAVDSRQRVVVLDPARKQIRVFEHKGREP